MFSLVSGRLLILILLSFSSSFIAKVKTQEHKLILNPLITLHLPIYCIPSLILFCLFLIYRVIWYIHWPAPLLTFLFIQFPFFKLFPTFSCLTISFLLSLSFFYHSLLSCIIIHWFSTYTIYLLSSSFVIIFHLLPSHGLLWSGSFRWSSLLWFIHLPVSYLGLRSPRHLCLFPLFFIPPALLKPSESPSCLAYSISFVYVFSFVDSLLIHSRSHTYKEERM